MVLSLQFDSFSPYHMTVVVAIDKQGSEYRDKKETAKHPETSRGCKNI